MNDRLSVNKSTKIFLVFYFIPKINFFPYQTTFEHRLGLTSAPAHQVQALIFFRGCWLNTLACLRCMKPWLLCCWERRPVTPQSERWAIFHFVKNPLRQAPSSCVIVLHLQVCLDDVLQSLIDGQADAPAEQLCVEAAMILLELLKCIISQVIQ